MARAIYREQGDDWFLAQDVDHIEGFYHGVLVAMRGSCLVASKNIGKRNMWRLTTNCVQYIHDESYRGNRERPL